MSETNAFGEEIDEDGLPKYAPGGKNIAAYQMYKLAMTDKMPDPEESHTPFFRTPSYYREKALREQQEDLRQPKTEPLMPVIPERLRPHLTLQASRDAGVSEGDEYTRRLIERAFGQQTQPDLLRRDGGGQSNRSEPHPLADKRLVPVQRQEPADPLSPTPAPAPVKKSSPFSSEATAKPVNGMPVPTKENSSGSSGLPGLIEGAMNTFNQAFSQFNNVLSADDIRAMYGSGETQASDGQAGKVASGSGQSVGTAGQGPSANADCAPLPVTPPTSRDARLKPGRRMVSPEMTDHINQELTRQNECRPIGINSSQVSIFEGGSHERAYVPY